MAQVPYQPYPTERPDEGGPRGFSVHTPVEAFGGAVGHALEGLGKEVAHVGDELFNRAIQLKHLQNETAAKNADAQYMIESGMLHEKFATLEGENAGQDALKEHIHSLEQLREKYRDTLPNDDAKRMYDPSSISSMGRSIFNGARHSATQTRSASHLASQARSSAMLNTIHNDPNSFDALLPGLRSEIETQGHDAGWNDKVTAENIRQIESKAWAHRLTGLSKTEPFKAIEMYEANRDKIHFNDVDKVESTLYEKGSTVEARNISDRVLEDLGDRRKEEKSLKDYLKAGETAVQESPITDESRKNTLKEKVERDIVAKFNRQKASEAQFERDQMATIEGFLSGSKGTIPGTLDELLAHDKAAKAYDALSDAGKIRVQNAIVTLSKRGDKVDATTSLKTRDTLIGLSQENPDKFMDTDIYSKDLKINAGDRKFLSNLRERLRKAPEQSPRVAEAITQIRSALGSEMSALRIYRREKSNEDDWNHFVGALQQGLEVWQEEHRRRPTNKELIEEIGKPLLKSKEGGWFSKSWFDDPRLGAIFGSEESRPPLYQVDTSTKEYLDFETKIKADVKDFEGDPPTDEQVRRAYVRTKFIELYSKKEKK